MSELISWDTLIIIISLSLLDDPLLSIIRCLAYRSSSVFTMTPLASFMDQWKSRRGSISAGSLRCHAQGQHFQARDWHEEAWNLACARWETGKHTLKYMVKLTLDEFGWNLCFNGTSWITLICLFQSPGIDGNKFGDPDHWLWAWDGFCKYSYQSTRGEQSVCVSLSCIMTISLSWGCHQQQHHHHQHHCHVSVVILINGITAIIMRVYINSRHHGRVQATSHGCTCKNHVQIMLNTQWHETQMMQLVLFQ